jgi:hypothetical protein
VLGFANVCGAMTRTPKLIFFLSLTAVGCGEAAPDGLISESTQPLESLCTGAVSSVVPATASNVIDGNTATHFGSGNNNWQTVTIDLGCTARVTGVRRNMVATTPSLATRNGQGEMVSVSNDNVTFTPLTFPTTFGWGPPYVNYGAQLQAWHTVGYGWSRFLRPNTPIQARYVRFQWDGNFDAVTEVEVDTKTISVNQAVTSGSVYNAIDGNSSTGFTTAQTQWQQVEVDFGRSVALTRLRRNMSGASANRGENGEQIQVSADGTTWRPIVVGDVAGWEAYTNYGAQRQAWKRMPYGWSNYLSFRQPPVLRYLRYLWDGNSDNFNELELETTSPTAMSTVLLPTNGTVLGGGVEGQPIEFSGFASTRDAQIRVQILRDPALSPSLDSSWDDLLATPATPQSVPTVFFGDAHYPFEISVTPTTNGSIPAQLLRWPPAGVALFRVLQNNVPMRSFDDGDCPETQSLTRTQRAMSEACQSHMSGVISVADGDDSQGAIPPQQPSGTEYLSRFDTVNNGSFYYQHIGAESNLNLWRTNRGFPAGEVVTRFYNAGDLGLGREMHCRTNAATGQVSCYVTNYGSAADGLNDEASALASAVAGTNPVATVAMDFRPNLTDDSVRFYVYVHNPITGQTSLAPQVALDSEGLKDVPGVCIACHSGQFQPATRAVRNAEFLPFDLDSYSYSTVPGHTRAAQEENFRLQNAMVLATQPPPAITELINGWYHNTPGTANTVFDGNFVPNGWRPACSASVPCKSGYLCSGGVCLEDASVSPRSDPEGITVYRQVYAKYCRTCHVAMPISPLPIDTYAAFSAGAVQFRTCDQPQMPHAELTRYRFWQSNARGHLIGAIPMPTGCGE